MSDGELVSYFFCFLVATYGMLNFADQVYGFAFYVENSLELHGMTELKYMNLSKYIF